MPLESHRHFQRKYLLYFIILILFTGFMSHDVCYLREFYTGWLTHWGEKLAETDAKFTAAALENILAQNGSAVLYVCSQTPTLLLLSYHYCGNVLIWAF